MPWFDSGLPDCVLILVAQTAFRFLILLATGRCLCVPIESDRPAQLPCAPGLTWKLCVTWLELSPSPLQPPSLLHRVRSKRPALPQKPRT